MRTTKALRAVAMTGAVAAALVVTVSGPAQAYWIYNWAGPFSGEATCEATRLAHMQDEYDNGQQVTSSPCGYHIKDPRCECGNLAGWYYRHGIRAD